MSETKTKTAEEPVPIAEASTFQDVPLGGQPVREHATHEGMKADTKAQHETCAAVWDTLIKALQKAVADCPEGRAKGSMEIRNHATVWLAQAQNLRDAL